MTEEGFARASQINKRRNLLIPFINSNTRSDRTYTPDFRLRVDNSNTETVPDEYKQLLTDEYAIAQDRIIREMKKELKKLNAEFESLK